MNKQTLIYLAVFIAGVITASKVRTLPVLSKLPTI